MRREYKIYKRTYDTWTVFFVLKRWGEHYEDFDWDVVKYSTYEEVAQQARRISFTETEHCTSGHRGGWKKIWYFLTKVR